MDFVTKENIALVDEAFAKFVDDMVKSGNLNLQELFVSAESKFAEAGHRNGALADSRQGNILILHDGAVGDLVAESGAIREIRRIYPDAHITLVVTQSVFELAEFCPHVNEVLVNPRIYNAAELPDMLVYCMQATKILRNRYYDVCYNFAKWPDMMLMMYLSGARVRITHDFRDDRRQIWHGANNPLMRLLLNLATHLAPLNLYGKHMADACFSLVDGTLYAPVSNRRLEVWYTAHDVTIVKSIVRDLSPLYALSMGGSHGRKHYPPEKYSRLLEMILDAEPNATFVILGGGESDLQSAAIVKDTVPEIYENHVIDLTNKLRYRQVAAILSLCDMYIGNDNGAMHMAAAVQCPVLNANCFPKDLPLTDNDVPILWGPYNTPSVVVQPARALSECTADKPYDHHGCKVVNEPHCIAQIRTETLFRGFNLLKQRAEQKLNDTLYIY